MGAKWEWDKKKCKGECQCWHDFDAFLLTNEILGKRPTASECDDLIYDVLEPEFGLYLCHMRLFLCNGQISKHQTKNFDRKKLDKKTSERKQNRSTNCVQCKYIENDLFRSIWPHWNYYVSLLFVKFSFCLKMASPHACTASGSCFTANCGSVYHKCTRFSAKQSNRKRNKQLQ